MGHSPVTGRGLPIFLGLAVTIPTIFGGFRAHEIITTGVWAFAFDPSHVDRLPLFLHVLGACAFLALGLLQVLPGFRRRHPRWHRRAGRLIVPAGLLGALSGVWMTWAHPANSGALLYWGRLTAGLGWAGFILVSVGHLRARDFARHGRWMIRAFALALPAGTLAFIMLPPILLFGEAAVAPYTEAIQVAAWPAHLAIAEWVIRRRMAPAPAGLRAAPAS